jgi:sec-independent protein translocase protein TatC
MTEPVLDQPRYLADHLRDLRKGIIRSLIAVAVGVGLAFWQSGPLFAALLRPFQEVLEGFPDVAGRVETLQTLAPIEAFMVHMKLAGVTGLVLASPILLREIWAFTSPALKPLERAGLLIVFSLGLFFFAGGVVFGYKVIVPLALKFLINYNLVHDFIPVWTLQNYFSFVVNFLLIFGVIFELPLVLAGLVAAGIATPAFLIQKWRHAVIGIFILAAVIAPSADPLTQTLVALPLVALYGLGILFSLAADRLIRRRRANLGPDGGAR